MSSFKPYDGMISPRNSQRSTGELIECPIECPEDPDRLRKLQAKCREYCDRLALNSVAYGHPTQNRSMLFRRTILQHLLCEGIVDRGEIQAHLHESWGDAYSEDAFNDSWVAILDYVLTGGMNNANGPM